METFIDLNGIDLVHADSLRTNALDRRFGDQPWHFHQTCVLNGAYCVESKVLQRHKGKCSKLAFMDV